jgi:hypothetical protein
MSCLSSWTATTHSSIQRRPTVFLDVPISSCLSLLHARSLWLMHRAPPSLLPCEKGNISMNLVGLILSTSFIFFPVLFFPVSVTSRFALRDSSAVPRVEIARITHHQHSGRPVLIACLFLLRLCVSLVCLSLQSNTDSTSPSACPPPCTGLSSKGRSL